MRLYPFLLVLAVLFISCADNSGQVNQLQSKVDLLEKRLDGIDKKIDDLLVKDKPESTGLKAKAKKTRKKDNQLSLSSQDIPTYTAPLTRETSGDSWECQAITKKGTRCKRAARSGGYCWQHGG